MKKTVKNAKDMMLDGEFSASECKKMRVEIVNKLDQMYRAETQLRAGIENHDTKIDDCLELLLNLYKYYVSKTTEVKQKIIGSMFPEKLIFLKITHTEPKKQTMLLVKFELLTRTRNKKKGRKLISQFFPLKWSRRDFVYSVQALYLLHFTPYRYVIVKFV